MVVQVFRPVSQRLCAGFGRVGGGGVPGQLGDRRVKAGSSSSSSTLVTHGLAVGQTPVHAT